MMGESAESVVERFNARRKELARPLIRAAALNALSTAGAPGGELYEKIAGQMEDSANAVYGGYTPKKYRRRGTLTDPGNYNISFNFSVGDDSAGYSCSIQNQATGDEDGLLEPLIMGGWKRPKYYWPDGPKRPWSIGGRDLYSKVIGGDMDLELSIDLSGATEQAYREIIIPWKGGGANA